MNDKDQKAEPKGDDESKAAAPKFKDGEYEVAAAINHEGKAYAPGDKVKLTAADAETLAGIGAIKPPA